MKNIFSILVVLMFFNSGNAYSQQLTNYDVPFNSGGPQSMWGPNGINVGLNQTWDLFGPWGINAPFNVGGIVNAPLGAGQFGIEMSGNFQFDIGLEFALENFTLGQIEVEYPIDIEIDVPTDLTYDQGDDVDIRTSYELDPGWYFESFYPNPGTARLTLNVGIGAALDIQACFISCFGPVTIIPQFYEQIPIDIFNLDFDLTDGDGMDASLLNISGIGALFEYDIPDTLYTSMIDDALDPSPGPGQYGLSGWFTPPHVDTYPYLVNPEQLDIAACGESQYVELDLEIFQLLGNIPQLTYLQYLSDSYSFDVGPMTFEIYWNIISASLRAGIYNKQCFDFEPTIYGKYEFPVPVEYQIFDGASGLAISALDTSSIIELEVGDNLRYKFPCYFDELDIKPTFRIDGQLTGHTYDSIPLDFCYSGLEFGVNFDDFTILPPLPPLPYPCGVQWCSSWGVPYPCGVQICWTSAFGGLYLYDIISPFSVGPFIPENCINITSVTYDWMPVETWSMPGFLEYNFDSSPFHMQANVLGVSNTHIDIDCNGGNSGSIDVSFSAISPATPYTYDWTNGATTEDLTGLTAGPYELSAFDANGCQLVTGATILEPNSPVTITTSYTDKNCNGGVDDGTASLLIQGGTPPYSVSWSNGANTQNITGLNAGVYVATVTDSKGCQEVASVTISEPNVLGQVGAITDVLCTGANDGEVAVDVFGGTMPYSYSWNTGQSTEDISNLTAGTYTLTLTDINNCTSVDSYVVNEPTTTISLSVTGVDILCKNDSTGSIDLTVNGGSPGYSFQWSNAQNIILPYTSEDLTNVPAGSYTVLVTDVKGCTASISIILNEPSEVLYSTPNLVNILCNGASTGSIDPMISGGTPGYTYAWGGGSNGATNVGLPAGTYTLTVTDINACLFSTNYVLTEPTALTLVTSATDVLCNGESTGGVQVEATEAVPGYTYLWSNGSSSSIVENLPAGTYTVDVTDANGCVESDVVIVSEPVAPLNVNYAVTDVDCFGSNSGAIDMTASDGTGPYTYLWSNSGNVVLIDTTEDISGLYADNYLLTITDANNCILNSSVIVNEPPSQLEISGITTDVLCFGGNNGAIDLNISGGTSGYSYLWSTGATSEDVTNLFAGTYDVTVTDANNCTETASYTLTEPPTAVVAQLELNDVSCLGGSDGYILTSVEGGVEPYTYLWSTGETTDIITNITAGAYSVTVTDANGCTSFTGGVINEPTSTVSINYLVDEISCFGGSDGTIGINANGGSEPYYYNWGNQNNILMAAEGEVLVGLNAGEYLIQITDANGCLFEQVISLTEPPLLETSFTTVDVLCNGDATGSIDVTNWGGTEPYSTVWSTGDVTEDLNSLVADWYYFEVTDYHGCVVSDSAQIFQPPGFWTSHYIQELSCMEETDGYISIEIGGGVDPYTYLWSNGSMDSEIGNLSAGAYNVVFEDANGCTDSLEFVINPNYESCLEIPNTFSPNGDNYNDTWFIEYLYLYPNAEVAIFNKWGNELYRSDSPYEPWDGTINGVPLPSEVYYYIILLNNDQADKYTGVVTIIR